MFKVIPKNEEVKERLNKLGFICICGSYPFIQKPDLKKLKLNEEDFELMEDNDGPN